ncbi:MAG: ammonium transporter, partial [Thaumarchaeota archaeon]|nr:ammonium transporter [Candidatus Calditenuaceae archaeon]MDW8186841.1 ammonium transporter [Nitrososphaerota archaeon]
GLGFFYAGLERKKNVVSTLFQCFAAVGVISIVWILWGYSLAFGPDRFGLIGGLEWFGLNGVGPDPNPDYAATVPHSTYAIYQMMFAVITPALIAGAFAERVKFGSFLLFLVAWSTFGYSPLAHWVWGVGGWLRGIGALDFAGGTVVHISSGVSALVAALVLGRRLGYGNSSFEPSNPTYVLLGAALLWFGWFGFNAGSALASNSLASQAFLNTHAAASAGAISWLIANYYARGKFSSIAAASGAVAGLVAITPAAGFVSVSSALVIGAVAGVLCSIAVNARQRFGVDDSLDVWGVHGVGGTWGAIATGIFADASINPAGVNGLLAGNPSLIASQLIGVAATWAFASIVTLLIVKLIDVSIGLRVPPREEVIGLDISQHAEYVS